jgi:hypothetical protein
MVIHLDGARDETSRGRAATLALVVFLRARHPSGPLDPRIDPGSGSGHGPPAGAARG